MSASRPEPCPVLSVAPPFVAKSNCDLRNLTTPRLPNGSAETVRSSTLLMSMVMSLKILGTLATRAKRFAPEPFPRVPVGIGLTVKSA